MPLGDEGTHLMAVEPTPVVDITGFAKFLCTLQVALIVNDGMVRETAFVPQVIEIMLLPILFHAADG